MSKHNSNGAKTAPEPEKTAAQAEPQGKEGAAENPELKAEPSIVGLDVNTGQSEEKEKASEDRIAELEAQLAELNDQYLRKAADFENFRKRMNRERQDAIEYANQSLLLDLIQIMDDFDRALKSGESLAGESPDKGQTALDQAAREQAAKSFYEGVAMIGKRLSSQMENKWGLKPFISAGEPFDPNRHEAVMMDKSSEITEPMVIEEFFKGYTLKERVIRHAQVKVLMPEQSAPVE
ncbi:MAG: nucleotide exchange factor GrpE [Treponema sp.]|jgi:molecular chaperone GrpE|nr:nucleotide exchange factor GrpE [Treponema sp.]